MSLKQRISDDLKAALKGGERDKAGTLRLLVGAIQNVEIDKLKREAGLDDEEIIEVVSRSIKQRRDSIDQFEKGGRPELAAKEKAEIDILMVYMPAQLDDAAVRQIVSEVIVQSGAASVKDMGRVMGMVMVRVKGQADGTVIRQLVESELQKLAA